LLLSQQESVIETTSTPRNAAPRISSWIIRTWQNVPITLNSSVPVLLFLQGPRKLESQESAEIHFHLGLKKDSDLLPMEPELETPKTIQISRRMLIPALSLPRVSLLLLKCFAKHLLAEFCALNVCSEITVVAKEKLETPPNYPFCAQVTSEELV